MTPKSRVNSLIPVPDEPPSEVRHLKNDPVALAEAEKTLKRHVAKQIGREKQLGARRSQKQDY